MAIDEAHGVSTQPRHGWAQWLRRVCGASIFSAPVHHGLKRKALACSKARSWCSPSLHKHFVLGHQHGFGMVKSEHVNCQHWFSPQKDAPLVSQRVATLLGDPVSRL